MSPMLCHSAEASLLLLVKESDRGFFYVVININGETTRFSIFPLLGVLPNRHRARNHITSSSRFNGLSIW